MPLENEIYTKQLIFNRTHMEEPIPIISIEDFQIIAQMIPDENGQLIDCWDINKTK